MRIASWNVNSLKVRLPQVLDWLERAGPDVLALQETKLTDEHFPHGAIREAGYYAVAAGQRTYNGVATLSRAEPGDPLVDPPGLTEGGRRVLATTHGDVRVINFYVVNGQAVGSDKYDFKLQWLERAAELVAQELNRHRQLLVVGDFNIAPDDRDVHDPEAWRDSILCSEPERAALRRFFDLGLVDCYRLFEQPEGGFSWWDYRRAALRRNHGLRIDLILASRAAAERCTNAWIDTEPRHWERPSDHAPVLAELD